jgi:hypothetical protein
MLPSFKSCSYDVLFQGQALAKVNIGNVLDSCGDWAGALQAYEEGYRQCLDVFLFKSETLKHIGTL